jgi:hypothetical protein
MTHKTWLYTYLTLLTVTSLSIITINFSVDPLLQFGYKPDKPSYFKGDNRSINPGIIKHLDYDTIMLGTSMAVNFLPADIDRILTGNNVNLSMSGSSAYEQARIASMALSTQKANTVYWGLDLFAFSGNENRGLENFPAYLYSAKASITDQIKYLLNPYTLKLSLKTLKYRGEEKYQRYFDLRKITYGADKYTYNRKQTLKHWRNRSRVNENKTAYSQERLRHNFNLTIRRVIRENPHVQFVFFMPPYSILEWQKVEEKGLLSSQLNFKNELVEQLAQHTNVELHDFQNDISITHNLNNYKDPKHYSNDINLLILHSIKNQSHRINNPEQTFVIQQQLEVLDIDSFTQE